LLTTRSTRHRRLHKLTTSTQLDNIDDNITTPRQSLSTTSQVNDNITTPRQSLSTTSQVNDNITTPRQSLSTTSQVNDNITTLRQLCRRQYNLSTQSTN
uniref:Uncharacterized protein n=1 Tax=Meloidogyne floridensis TaxID=298350 RepID=A0A915NMR3_9BILA